MTELDGMKVVGYSNKLTVHQGEKIKFMVSSKLPKYKVDIVRLLHGDVNPKGPGFKEKIIETKVNGYYKGKIKTFNHGSYVKVSDNSLLNNMKSFSIQVWIFPTSTKSGNQFIVSKWVDSHGYALLINNTGNLTLWLGNKNGDEDHISTPAELISHRWYFVAVTYNSETKSISLVQEPLRDMPLAKSKSTVKKTSKIEPDIDNGVELLISGYWIKNNLNEKFVKGNFNGKIDGPKIYNHVLNDFELSLLKNDKLNKNFVDNLVASWDFSQEISSSKIIDSSKNKLHGLLFNMPIRAVTGHNWSGDEINFNYVKNEYGAIYFHDDDLDDACWDVDFEFTVPNNLPSGVYAAKLTVDNADDHIPFFVCPKKGTSNHKIAVLVPTLTYIAYANEHHLAKPETQPIMDFQGGKFTFPVANTDKYAVAHQLSGLYDTHSDNSGVCYSSRLRPITNLRPKYYDPILSDGQGSPCGLCADLCLLNWLDVKEYDYDVITDEALHYEGVELLDRYNVIITGSHPEYWTSQMLHSLENYLNKGGKLMYLGGNGFYWITSISDDKPHVIEIRRWGGTQMWVAAPGEYYHSTSGELGGIWRNRGRAPQLYTGVGFTSQGFDTNSPYYRNKDSFDPRATFIFEGVSKDEVIGDFESLVQKYGAAGFELDRADHKFGTPTHCLILATSSGHSDAYQFVTEEVNCSDSKQGGTVHPLVKADMVYFEYPNNGAVFSVGSISWSGSLYYNNYDNNISRITENVLKKFSI